MFILVCILLVTQELARRLQREEIKKSRRNKQRQDIPDDELKRLEHDEVSNAMTCLKNILSLGHPSWYIGAYGMLILLGHIFRSC